MSISNRKNQVKHLIDIDQLNLKNIEDIFLLAEKYLSNPYNNILAKKTLVNLFFENSTRTRCSFSTAAKNMGARVIDVDISHSSLKKGESEADTILTLNAMQTDFLTIRHNQSGMVKKLSDYCFKSRVINSGDGSHAHPTQALLDVFTIYQNKKFGNGLDEVGIS